MRQIFIFTAGDRHAREHLKDSILNAVPIAWLGEELPDDQGAYYQSLIPDSDGFHAWGAVPGPVNKRTWEAMQVGDLVLAVYDNGYQYLSSIIAKFNNAPLANRIWGKDDSGETWQYMYLLNRPQPVAVNVMSEPVANYLNRGYRGFTRISDAKVQAILDAYGSLDAFVQQVFQGKIPESHVERELGQAEAEASDLEAFNPGNMVDGRRKVIQEIVRRQGQPVFRRKLLKAYDGRCVVTDCAVEAVLEAAHIAPYLGTGSNVVQNGLLLRADIHTLFDLGLFRIAPDGTIHLHEKLLGTVYEQYRGQTIRAPMDRINGPCPDALALKYDLVL